MPPSPPLDLRRDRVRPLHLQLTEGLRAAILDGRFRPSDRLPPIRQLAADLGVARATVVTAYEQLAAEGYLVARVGSGTSVAPELPESGLRARSAADAGGLGTGRVGGAGAEAVGRDGSRAVSAEGSVAKTRREGRFPPIDPRLPRATYRANQAVAARPAFDFRTGRPAYDLFPAEAWERLLRDAWRDLAAPGHRALDYPDPAGDERLRRAIADHLGLARGVRCRPSQVMVLAGSQAAFAAAARLWLRPEAVAVLEDPGYPMARRAVLASGARVVSRLVDAHGLPTDRLPERATMAIVTPSWQFPLGGTLPVARRLALLDWARQAGAVVLEDDYDSELRYAGRPLASLQGLDDDGRVLYVGTFSKVAFPALRLGFAVVPEAVTGAFAAAIELQDRGVGIIEQAALARFVESGAFERHLRRARIAYAARQEALLDAIEAEAHGLLSAPAAPAGMHLVARLGDGPGPTAGEVAEAARSAGVEVVPVTAYRIAPAPDRELVLGYPALTPDEIREGIRRLAHVIRSLSRRSPEGS